MIMNKDLARKTMQFVAVFILNILFINLSLKAILFDGPAAVWPASGVGIGFMLSFQKRIGRKFRLPYFYPS